MLDHADKIWWVWFVMLYSFTEVAARCFTLVEVADLMLWMTGLSGAPFLCMLGCILVSASIYAQHGLLRIKSVVKWTINNFLFIQCLQILLRVARFLLFFVFFCFSELYKWIRPQCDHFVVVLRSVDNHSASSLFLLWICDALISAEGH